MAEQDTSGRVEYLLDGRRVRVADLLAAGLIDEGTKLVFERKRIGRIHRATVAGDGSLILEDGRPYRSPSKAAAVAAAAKAFDGWHAWVVEESGRSLDSLRQDLLDNLAAQADRSGSELADDASDSRGSARNRHEKLKQAREAAAFGQPLELSVHDLLAWWGASRRGSSVGQQMEADLANYGLTTSPNFLKVAPDTPIKLLSILVDPDEGADDSEPSGDPVKGDSVPAFPLEAAEAVASEGAEDEQPIVGLSIGNLPPAMGRLTAVSPQATLDEAITLMLLNDFSQLAVLSGSRGEANAISWKSIAKARNIDPDATLADATFRAPEARYDEELIDVLPRLEPEGFVLVRDATRAIRGIVTTTDVVGAYQNLATPFMLIGTLEQKLRQLVGDNFEMVEISKLCDPVGSRAPLERADLTLGDYERVLENPMMWEKLGWSLDRNAFVSRLKLLREIRNDVMHFNPDPLPEDAISNIRNFIGMLDGYGAS